MNAIDNAFTVDVEDYFHVQAFADRIDPRHWDQFESRVTFGTHRILRLLDKHQTAATFFVLGWVAERQPQLVRDIQRAGHDIGCHSFWHRLVFEQSRDSFRADLRLATTRLQDITGNPVTAYRAPSFSITARSLWALDVLIEEGYEVDSSIFPVRHDVYGVPDANPAPHVVRRSAGSIVEIPPAVRCKPFANIPVAGGGYFRQLPYWLTRHWLRNINRKENRPFVFYIHPWELDPDQPRLSAGLKSRLRHYRNLHTTEGKLDRLLNDFSFQTLSQLARATFPPEAVPVLEDTATLIDTVPEIPAPEKHSEPATAPTRNI